MLLYHLNHYCHKNIPLAVWEMKTPGNSETHWHDCMELMLITRGSGVSRINNIAYPVLRGDLFVLNPDDFHSYEMKPGCRFYNLLFQPSLLAHVPELKPLLQDWSSGAAVKLYRIKTEYMEHMEQLAIRLEDELKSTQVASELMAQSLFGEFLARLLRQENKPTSGGFAKGTPLELAAQVIEYMDRNSHRKLSIKEIAKFAGMSESAFTSAFRRWTENSAMEFLARLRIRKACGLLRNHTMSIAEIGFKTGFCDSSHFSRTFRRATGISPREYRNLALSAPNENGASL